MTPEHDAAQRDGAAPFAGVTQVQQPSGHAAPVGDTATVLVAADAVWRRIGPLLWVGRWDGYPIGIIEHGHRWTAIDAADRVVGRYDSLEDAQRALGRHR